jgi:hypothetical protein
VKRPFKLFLALLPAAALSACAYSIHEAHVSDFHGSLPAASGRMVRGQADQFVILGFTQQTDYVNQALARLIAQCPNGALASVMTRLSTDLGFFSWTNRAAMEGQCVSAAR